MVYKKDSITRIKRIITNNPTKKERIPRIRGRKIYKPANTRINPVSPYGETRNRQCDFHHPFYANWKAGESLFPVFFYTSHNVRLFLCRIGAGEV
jgi:hypothetical protein